MSSSVDMLWIKGGPTRGPLRSMEDPYVYQYTGFNYKRRVGLCPHPRRSTPLLLFMGMEYEYKYMNMNRWIWLDDYENMNIWIWPWIWILNMNRSIWIWMIWIQIFRFIFIFIHLHFIDSFIFVFSIKTCVWLIAYSLRLVPICLRHIYIYICIHAYIYIYAYRFRGSYPDKIKYARQFHAKHDKLVGRTSEIPTNLVDKKRGK